MYVYSIILYICLAFLTVYPPIHHQYVMRISRNKNKMGCLHHRPDALLAQNHPCICIYIAITLIHRIRVEKYIGVQRQGYGDDCSIYTATIEHNNQPPIYFILVDIHTQQSTRMQIKVQNYVVSLHSVSCNLRVQHPNTKTHLVWQ